MLALLCAAALWTYLDSFVEDERTLLIRLPQEGELASDRRVVAVTVRGPSRVVRKLRPESIRLVSPPRGLPSDFALPTGEVVVTRVEIPENMGVIGH